MLVLYNLFIRLYSLAIRLASLWNKKAALWVEGRRNWYEELETNIEPGSRYVWMHCSSAGELEQGKPVAEALKTAYPNHKLLISFFSPSGFGVAKNYPFADITCYLPLDTKRNAERFIQAVKPELVLFVKYEFWYHYLTAVALHHIPLLLVSAVFRQEQIFFKWYGRFFRQMLHRFRHIFVQDEVSLHLLKSTGINHCRIGGDTRFDRVSDIQKMSAPVPLIENFLQDNKAVVAGSTWTDDENLLKKFLGGHPGLKLIIAPHEVNEGHLQQLQKLFPEAIMYSAFQKQQEKLPSHQVLIIDGVGLLSRLYQHATITYVGGGFTKDGIHNILEAAVWGKPVVFGPNYKKYREAMELIEAGGGFSTGTAAEIKKLADSLLGNEQDLQAAGKKAKDYVEANTGATKKIVSFIQENRLLTN